MSFQRSAILLVCIFIYSSLSSQLRISKTWCENLVNPIGIDEPKPTFSWQIQNENATSIQQKSYEIKIAIKQEDLAKSKNLFWTDNVMSNQSLHLVYNGKSLNSNTKYFWQVRIIDNANNISSWSEVSTFQTGLMKKEDWKAKWITSGLDADTTDGPAALLRKSFSIKKKIVSATAFITSKGVYQAFLNGTRIGNDHLTPGWTSYNNRIQYQTYDVTNLLMDKNNTIGTQLGSGWYRTKLGWVTNKNIYGNKTALLLQINIKYKDGSEEVIISDESWKASEGPIRLSEIYDGEIYDARLEKISWNKNEYNDESWTSVQVLPAGKEVIVSTVNETIKKRETFKPKEIITTPNGEKVIDFGQNLVGRVRIKGSAKPGDILQWKHFEVLDKFGNVYLENMRAAKVNTTYTFAGNKAEDFAPNFTFYGFRYIWIEKGAELMANVEFEAEAMYSDMEKTGDFECSNPMINQLQHNIQWGQRGNFLDVPTDCPQRDERLGWTGDAQAFARTAGYNFHVHGFFKKWLKDLAFDQLENGSVPFVIPNVLGKNSAGSTGWADAATIIPWDMYVMYGDKRILSDQYPSMKKWVEYMRTQSVNDLWNKGFHFGDWLFFSRNDDNGGESAVSDKYLIAQCFYAHSTQILVKTAELLGKKEDATEYRMLLAKIKKAFQDEYITKSGRLLGNTQTSYILALRFDMLNDDQKVKAAAYLVENINRYKHITTGFLGTPYINHVLTQSGYDTVAYKLLLRKEYPSWLYPITKGATTIWERWDGIQADSNFQAKTMNSFNHYAYGAIGDWMYQNITGIRADENNPGYKKFEIKPHLGGGLTYAKASLNTYYGKIQSNWELIGNGLKMDIEVPANTNAKIYIPMRGSKIMINGSAAEENKQISSLGALDNYKVVEVGSGKYLIESN